MLKSKYARFAAIAALTTGALLVPTVSQATTTTAIISIDNPVSGWNNATSANNDFRLGQILNMMSPSPYLIDNHGALVLATDIVTKASSALVKGKQVVTYTINPKAVWSDNVPVNADDFIYIYQALSCNDNFKDVGGATYDAAGCSGYNQIESVVGSKPVNASGAALACSAGTTGARNLGLCPNGKTVTVTFKAGQPFPEWQALFGLLPAHVVRTVGFNTGYDDDSKALDNVLSAGPYVLQSFDRSANTYTEVVNPKWWGTAPKIHTLIFKDLGSDTNGVAGLSAGDYNVFEPTTVTKAISDQADAASGVTSQLIPGYMFEHLDFNQANTDLKSVKVRQAIGYAVSRTAMIAATVGSIYTTGQLDSHIFMSNQVGYKANGKAFDIGGTAAGQKKAKDLLTSAGYKYGTDGYFHKGSTTGTKLTFNLWMNGTSARTVEAQIIQGELRQVGIVVNIHTASNGTILGSGNFDMVIFAWVGSPLLSGNKDIYGCNGGSNYDNYCNTAVTALMAKANTETTIKAEAADYNKADVTLWTDLPTLPLYQKPMFVAYTNNIHGVLENPTSAGADWNANKWSIS